MKDGSIYKGFWLQKKRHGHGKMRKGIDSYEGLWENDQISGLGTYQRSGKGVDDCWIATGKWSRGKSENAEVYYIKDQYIGEFDIDLGRNGKGVMLYDDGSIYDGHWYNNLKDGAGTLTYYTRNNLADKEEITSEEFQEENVEEQFWNKGKLVPNPSYLNPMSGGSLNIFKSELRQVEEKEQLIYQRQNEKESKSCLKKQSFRYI